MKRLFLTLAIIVLLVFAGLYAKRVWYDPKHRLSNATAEVDRLVADNGLRDGDIIFQTSRSGQSKAIQQATKSKYSHCGIIYKRGKEFFVYEAVQPVKLTPLDKWIARGESGHYVIKRLKEVDRILTVETLQRMKKIGEKFQGKNYDLTFEWSDDRIYCSELVWKIYKEATGLDVGKLQHLRDFDLSGEAVQKKMKERYGDKIPMDETVISPVAIFDSELLMTVAED